MSQHSRKEIERLRSKKWTSERVLAVIGTIFLILAVGMAFSGMYIWGFVMTVVWMGTMVPYKLQLKNETKEIESYLTKKKRGEI